MKIERALRLRKYHATNDRGAAFVETAVGMWVFTLVLFGSIQLAQLVYHKTALQYTLSATMRRAILGTTVPPGFTEAQAIKQNAQLIGATYGLNIPASNIQICDTINWVDNPSTHTHYCSIENDTLIAGRFFYMRIDEHLPLRVLGNYDHIISNFISARKEP